MKKNWNYFVQEIKKHDDCVKYIKEKKYCKKHNDMEKCKKVSNFHDELKISFNSIKNIYKFAKLHLGQGRHNKNPWISFQEWEETLIYPCIIFDEKTKTPYLTIQVRQRDPMNDDSDKNLPIDVIKSIKNQIKYSKDYPISKIKSEFNFKNDMPKNRYIKSNIINTSFSDEKNIIAFNNLCKNIFKPKDQTIVAVFTEIIDNDSDAKKIFFKTSNNSTRFPKFIKNEINGFKEIIIIPFIKEINSKNKYIQLPIYKITKDAQIEKETKDYVYEASLHSLDIPNPIKSINTFIKNQKTKITEAAVKITHDEITEMIYEYSKKRNTDPTTSRTYDSYRRDRKVRELAIRLADKYCQLCEKIAPFFNKNNTEPFLESDHIKELKHGGLDIIQNVIALCPNCHRKKTYWDNLEGINEIIKTLKIKNKSLIDKYKNKK